MTIDVLIALAVPFVLGLLSGVIVKKAMGLIITVTALVIILVATGYVSIGFEGIKDHLLELVPKLTDQGPGVAPDWLNVLPYTSASFLVGLALGLWRG